ncbi:hypothetical protein [Rivibacter subsaxonicus]|uniref:hypothetical protein n=1 Tax=Rivibacter subsaxonicus TaxID=457575 RepID=UPI00102CDFC6|nr:hypothetical protein [Rivibacter subsaxonicus]
MPSLVFWILPFALLLPIVGLHLVRERLVFRLQTQRDPAAQHLSDWSFSAGLPGYANPIKREYVWGIESKALLRNAETKQLVVVARLLTVIFWVAFASTAVALCLELA